MGSFLPAWGPGTPIYFSKCIQQWGRALRPGRARPEIGSSCTGQSADFLFDFFFFFGVVANSLSKFSGLQSLLLEGN